MRSDPTTRFDETAPIGWPRIARGLRRAQDGVVWGALVVSGLTFLIAAGLFLSARNTNAKIRDLRAGKDVAVDAVSAAPALLEARAHFLLTRGRLDEAQPLLDQASLRADDAGKVRMLYNMANARVRTAIGAIEKGDFDRAIPLVSLAKSEYRSALRIDPQSWDAKYNLDVAMRLVRDLPRAESEDEAEPKETPAKLWTDLPGVPKGLP